MSTTLVAGRECASLFSACCLLDANCICVLKTIQPMTSSGAVVSLHMVSCMQTCCARTCSWAWAVVRQGLASGKPGPPSQAEASATELCLLAPSHGCTPKAVWRLWPHTCFTTCSVGTRHCSQQAVKTESFTRLVQTVKRTLQTALVWTIYEELQPAMKAAFQGSATHRPSQGGTTS